MSGGVIVFFVLALAFSLGVLIMIICSYPKHKQQTAEIEATIAYLDAMTASRKKPPTKRTGP